MNARLEPVAGDSGVIHSASERLTMLSREKFEEKDSKIDRKLDAMILGAVDETLTQIFKDVGAKVVYDFFEKNQHLKSEEIVQKPEVFSAGLESLLGSAAPVIEKRIIKNLYSSFRLEYVEKEEFVFSDYVKELR